MCLRIPGSETVSGKAGIVMVNTVIPLNGDGWDTDKGMNYSDITSMT